MAVGPVDAIHTVLAIGSVGSICTVLPINTVSTCWSLCTVADVDGDFHFGQAEDTVGIVVAADLEGGSPVEARRRIDGIDEGGNAVGSV